MTDSQAIAHTGAISPNNRVEITRNAKGDVQFSVRVADDDPEVAIKRAVKLYRQVEGTFYGG